MTRAELEKFGEDHTKLGSPSMKEQKSQQSPAVVEGAGECKSQPSTEEEQESGQPEAAVNGAGESKSELSAEEEQDGDTQGRPTAAGARAPRADLSSR